jgi:uncharacterized protein YxjI
MKLFLKRDISAEDTAFVVYDELGKEKYFIKSKNNKNNLAFNIVDKDNKTAAKIRKLPMVATTTFVFKVGKTSITLVCVPFANEIKFHYYGKNWHIAGDAVTKNFSIVDVDNSIIASGRKVLSDFELNIYNEDEMLYCIATSVCINLINTVDNRVTQAV